MPQEARHAITILDDSDDEDMVTSTAAENVTTACTTLRAGPSGTGSVPSPQVAAAATAVLRRYVTETRGARSAATVHKGTLLPHLDYIMLNKTN